MEKIHFDCDYMAGAHPKVLEVLTRNNLVQTPGYGCDPFCEEAKRKIKEACGRDDLSVAFLVGGTQTNSTILDAILGKTEGVIAADTGHINVHEAGAVELFGHKVLSIPNREGKIHPEDLAAYLKDFYSDDTYDHMVNPGAVYISFPTEVGTIYTLEELQEISTTCHEYEIPLFIDGARLGYGLAASKDVTLQNIAKLSDVFYIGGTKMGCLFGEAVVYKPQTLPKNFFTVCKAHGAVLAKGRLLGMQFGTLFSDNLYFRIGEHGVRLAMRLKEILLSHGYRTFIDSPTNQQFFILPNEVIDSLCEKVTFEYWGPRGETESRVRFVTSWETTEEMVEKVGEYLF